jgi:DNA-binding MarR family transcriptional regulator
MDIGNTTHLVDRIMTASTTVSRWGARDFKRRNLPGDLTATQFAILALLERHEGMNTSQLAERLDLSAPTVVRAVDALERKDLVTRSRSAHDHREVVLAMTDVGRSVKGAMEAARRERLMRLLSVMTDEQIKALVIGFEALARATETDGATTREAV